MWDLDTIIQMNAEAAQATRRDRTPLLRVAAGSDFAWPPEDAQVPFVGDAKTDFDQRLYRITTLFVDTSGFGRDDEPALSREQLKQKLIDLTEQYGPVLLGITEHGQFQAYIGVWKEGSADPFTG